MSYVSQKEQPMPTMGMQVGAGGGNRNAANKPVDSDGTREWSNDLFDCFAEFGTFCLALWLPCVVHGKNKQRLNHLKTHGSPDPDGGNCTNGACVAHCCLTSCTGFGGSILQAFARNDVRSRYSVAGGGCGDCCASCFCGPCDLVQVSREIELEESSFSQNR
ncbi:PLAC8-domain-containing protein [Mycena rebaudengoi]|nr:PLAC8-domain-containing protein [Mycena rebaudengoi]